MPNDSSPGPSEMPREAARQTAAPSTVVLVLGMHRSGTSALTRTLNLLGARLPGNLIPAQTDNETGFWESTDIQQLNDRILAALGSRWDDCRPLNLDALDVGTRDSFISEAEALLHCTDGPEPLALKEPRLCRLLPLWRTALAHRGWRAVAILPVRHPWEVATSLAARNGLALESGLLLWLRYVLDAERGSRGLRRVFVDYDALLHDWRGTLEPTLQALNVDLRIAPSAAAEIESFLRPDLRHHVASTIQHPMHRWIDTAMAALSQLRLHPDDPTSLERLDALSVEIDSAWQLVAPALLDAPTPMLASTADLVTARVPAGGREASALWMTEQAAQHARISLDTIAWRECFSIIMPTWNRCEHLPAAIDSVLAQSYERWELIISDDGSTDGTLSMLRERYRDAIETGRIRLIENDHRGVSAARNSALRAARHDWVAYLDSDNRWHPDYLLCVAAAYALHPHRRCTYAAIHVHDTVRNRDFVRWLAFDWLRLLRENYIDINIFSHHRSLYSELGGFDETLPRQEDWDLVLRYTRSHNPQRIPRVLCEYYLHTDLGNLTLTESAEAPDSAVRAKHVDDAAATEGTAPLSVLLADPNQSAIRDVLIRLRRAGVHLSVFSLGATPSIDASMRSVADASTLTQILAAHAHDAGLWLRTAYDAALARQDSQWRARLDRQRRDLQQQHGQLQQVVARRDQALRDQAAQNVREQQAHANQRARLEAALDSQRTRRSELEARLKAEQDAGAHAAAMSRARTLTLIRQRRGLLAKRLGTGTRVTLPPHRLFGERLSVRHRLHLWRQARTLLASGLFDALWYLQTAHDVALDGGRPIWHWLVKGAHEGRQPNPLFDGAWYLRRYADVAAAHADPLLHYLEHGAREGRDPGPLFSTRDYQADNPDVERAGVNPLAHFLRFGQHEGRAPNRWFDAQWYLERHPDVAAARLPALEHFLLAGGAEGRSPGPDFDSAWYLSTNADVRAKGLNPLVHYLDCGRREGRKPAPRPAHATSRVVAMVAPDSPQALQMQVTPERAADARAQLRRRSGGRFSIVMPTWNRATTITEAIDSVLAQTYEDWELIVCDDGSTDDTHTRVAERYADALATQRLRYLRLPHGGVCAARNAGLAAAQGTWVAYLDSDNTWRPDYLLMMAAALSAQPTARTAYACLHLRDSEHAREFIRCRPYDHRALLRRNFIDLNVFVHHRDLHAQLGGFDEQLRRLVDWDLILRYTRLYDPVFVPYVLCDYRIGRALNNITLTEPLSDNERAVRRKFAPRLTASGAEPPRIAYVLWDWPALSQTFVLEELRELRRRDIDVRVYYATEPDKTVVDVPEVEATRVADADELAKALVADERNWMHGHFAHLAVRDLIWPAAEKTGIAFSFMAHAIDIFPHRNRRKNRIGEVTRSPLCARVMVHGDYHRRFLVEHGVPADKIILTPQAVDTAPIRAAQIVARARSADAPLRVLAIARFVEKKGLEVLIEAAARLAPGSVQVRIHGYGPLEARYRELIRAHGLESRVQLCGDFEGADALRAALADADVFCLPCVEAQDGDADGMPTTFFEAMAAGVPCVGTTVSALPDFITDGITGFLAPPADPDALAATLRRVAQMPAEALAAVAHAARDWSDAHLGTRHTVDTLLDVCARPPIDVFMVTYHRDGHGDWAATERAIRSVLERSTTPLVLTIVDNGSDAAFLERLQALARGDERIRIVPLGENRMCGPASNVALSMARSEFVFYVCSNEGYVTRTGWERPCLRYMRNHPQVAIAGRLVASPAWPDGRGYAAQPWFKDFRNPEFALHNPDRAFFHVQGGLYVLRRSVFEKEGGFSERRPQAQTDVEYCYFLESRGYALGDIPELVVLSNKTRPGIDAFVDETTVALHPVFADSLALADAPGSVDARCNVCDWMGRAERAPDGVRFECPSCASSPHDRAVFRWLAGSNLHHRGVTLDARGLGRAVRDRLATMFTLADGDAPLRAADLPVSRPSRMLGLPPRLPPNP
ncbi:glycosyltransferase [Sinimarinibacterium flocculans]|uniref:glycosyltransferase n=1 Tax=Sinimarinibacterium flocculans TaxID=985250 RepID=UPI00351828CB